MERRMVLAIARVLFALLTIAAIVIQLADLAGKGVLNPISYFSYFTIDSNLIATAVLLLGASGWQRVEPIDRHPDPCARGGRLYERDRDRLHAPAVEHRRRHGHPLGEHGRPRADAAVIVADWLLDPPAVPRSRSASGLMWLAFRWSGSSTP